MKLKLMIVDDEADQLNKVIGCLIYSKDAPVEESLPLIRSYFNIVTENVVGKALKKLSKNEHFDFITTDINFTSLSAEDVEEGFDRNIEASEERGIALIKALTDKKTIPWIGFTGHLNNEKVYDELYKLGLGVQGEGGIQPIFDKANYSRLRDEIRRVFQKLAKDYFDLLSNKKDKKDIETFILKNEASTDAFLNYVVEVPDKGTFQMRYLLVGWLSLRYDMALKEVVAEFPQDLSVQLRGFFNVFDFNPMGNWQKPHMNKILGEYLVGKSYEDDVKKLDCDVESYIRQIVDNENNKPQKIDKKDIPTYEHDNITLEDLKIGLFCRRVLLAFQVLKKENIVFANNNSRELVRNNTFVKEIICYFDGRGGRNSGDVSGPRLAKIATTKLGLSGEFKISDTSKSGNEQSINLKPDNLFLEEERNFMNYIRENAHFF